MTTDAKCPNCGAAVPAGLNDPEVIPGNETSAVPQPRTCPGCGTSLERDRAQEAVEDGGWHPDAEPQA